MVGKSNDKNNNNKTKSLEKENRGLWNCEKKKLFNNTASPCA